MESSNLQAYEVDWMGDEGKIASMARISFQSKGDDASDARLLKFLIENNHLTPLEHCVFTFHVTAPIFVARQLFRYRIGTFSEQSGRYTELGKLYIPDVPKELKREFRDTLLNSVLMYQKCIKENAVTKEVARALLPMCTVTQFYWTVNLRNLLHICEERLTTKSQAETRKIVQDMWHTVEFKFPNIASAFQQKHPSLIYK